MLTILLFYVLFFFVKVNHNNFEVHASLAIDIILHVSISS
jgi:hypothetical protein